MCAVCCLAIIEGEPRCLQIEQASEALAAQLGVSAPKSKGFKTSGVKKLAVDVPVADQTAPAVRNLERSERPVMGCEIGSGSMW